MELGWHHNADFLKGISFMTTRPYELLARFKADGTIAGVSVRTLTTVDGKDYESDPVALSGSSDPAFAAFAAQFAAAAATERDSLQATLTARTAERDALQVQADRISGLESEISDLRSERDTRLTALVPPPRGPREVTPEEFLTRFSASDIVAIDQSTDPRVVIAKVTLQTRASVISLDSPLLAEMIDGLIAAGIPIDAADRERIFA